MPNYVTQMSKDSGGAYQVKDIGAREQISAEVTAREAAVAGEAAAREAAQNELKDGLALYFSGVYTDNSQPEITLPTNTEYEYAVKITNLSDSGGYMGYHYILNGSTIYGDAPNVEAGQTKRLRQVQIAPSSTDTVKIKVINTNYRRIRLEIYIDFLSAGSKQEKEIEDVIIPDIEKLEDSRLYYFKDVVISADTEYIIDHSKNRILNNDYYFEVTNLGNSAGYFGMYNYREDGSQIMTPQMLIEAGETSTTHVKNAGNEGWDYIYRTVIKRLNGQMCRFSVYSIIEPAVNELLNFKRSGDFAKYDYQGMLRNPNYDNMTHLAVKTDGSGDFATIQDAINSISDASVQNQYVIDIYDDFIITDMTKLSKTQNPTQAGGNNPTEEIALVVGKDWVHLRGIGKQKRLSVTSPENTNGESLQHIVTFRPFGFETIENIEFSISGGRYAIHHENDGRRKDYHRVTVFKDCTMIHYGNWDHNPGWTSCYAQANGTSSGCVWIYERCKWISYEAAPYYTHQNKDFDAPAKLIFENCEMFDNRDTGAAIDGVYFGDIGSWQPSEVIIRGCNFPVFNGFAFAVTYGNETERIGDNILQGGIRIFGEGNGKCLISRDIPRVIGFEMQNQGDHTIAVTGGTAYGLIWGEDFKNIHGASNYAARAYGTRVVTDRGGAITRSYVYSLAHRLGNCAGNSKTLVVRCDGTNYTITFDQNYVTADGSDYSYNTEPVMSEDQIIQAVNSQLETANCPARMVKYGYTVYDYFTDQKTPVCNNGNETIIAGKFYVRDYEAGMNRWKLPDDETDKADEIGFACDVFAPGDSGEMILADHAYFFHSGTVGNMYKFSSAGELEETAEKAEAIFRQITSGTMEKIN